MQTTTDNKVLRNYVSPKFCQELKYVGFAAPSKFFWKVYDMDVILDTDLFDMDDYYKEGNIIVDKIAPFKEILPAFTIKEIEAHLPDYCVCKCNGLYEITLDRNYNVEAINSDRLPDAFAKMMLAAIKKRVIDVTKLNSLK